MATQFQNRLIGTVILAALGIAFLPDLLMGKKNDISAPPGSIPLKPEQTVAAVTTNLPPATTNNSITSNNSNVVVSAPTSDSTGAIIVAGADKNTQQSQTIVVSEDHKTSNNAVVASQNNTNSKNEQWSVADVAPTVTISSKNVQATSSVDDSALKAKQERLQKEKDAALKKAQLVKQERLAKQAEQERLLVEQKKLQDQKLTLKPSSSTEMNEATQTQTTTAAEPSSKTYLDDSGLTIKTPAQVEAERLQRTQQKTVTVNQPTTAKSSTNTVAVNTTAKPQSGAWIIQLGVFSNAENAKSLVSRLRSSGFVASTQRVGTLTRVLVGPDTSKAKLQSQLSSINAVGGTSGKIIPYSAISN